MLPLVLVVLMGLVGPIESVGAATGAMLRAVSCQDNRGGAFAISLVMR